MTFSITCDGERRRRALARAALVAAVWSGSTAASAQTAAPKQQDPVAAQALFKAARQLVDKGNYAEGCPQFAASFELYPSASTMLNVAQCHEHDGKSSPSPLLKKCGGQGELVAPVVVHAVPPSAPSIAVPVRVIATVLPPILPLSDLPAREPEKPPF